MNGMERLRQIETKVRIISQRQMRQFMAGEIEMLPCSGDRLREEIAREFERVARVEAVK